VNTGAYRAYEMPVRNGQPVRDQFTLDRNGFAIIGTPRRWRTSPTGEVNRVYVGEVAEFVKSYTGADRVATLGWTLRRPRPRRERLSTAGGPVHDDSRCRRAGAGRGGLRLPLP